MTETTTLTDIPERVARGVALLDEKQPGWWQRIDLDRLNLDFCEDCILGQTYGPAQRLLGTAGFAKGAVDLIGSEAYGNDLNASGLVRLGFALPKPLDFTGDMGDAECAALTAEWKRAIKARRSAPVVSPKLPLGGEA